MIRFFMFFFILYALPGWAGNVPAPEPEFKGQVVLLPFYNYSGSSLKYVSTYMPELLSVDLKARGVEHIAAPDTVRQLLANAQLADDAAFDKERITAFLNGKGAAIGVTGRYIVHDKSIRFDLSLLDMATGRVIQSKTIESSVDDRFLDTLDRYAQGRADWIVEEMPALVTAARPMDFSIEGLVNRLKGSRWGTVLSSRWSFFVLVLILFVILAGFTGFFFRRLLPRLTSRTQTDLDDIIIDKARRPVQWTVLFAGGKAALLALGMAGDGVHFFNRLFTACMIVTLTWLVVAVVSLLIREWGRKMAGRGDSRIYDDLVPLLVNIVKFTIIIIAAVMVLSLFEIDIAPFIASLGIAGFAIGFAVKDILSNIIGGIVLLLDNAFALGDKVTIDNDTGIIREVGLRNTKLMTYDNEIIVIPNGELMNKKFKNYVLPDPKIRCAVDFTAAYGSSVEKVEEVVLGVAKSMEDVCADPAPVVIFRAMGDSALEFQIRFWINDYTNQGVKQEEATRKIYRAMVDAGLEIPFPTRTVYLKKEG